MYKKETPDRTLEFYNFWDYSNSANSDSWVSEKYLTWHVEADSILYHHESEYGPSETRVFNINGRSTPITILPLYAPKSEGIIGQEYFVDDIGIVLIKERDKVTYFDSTENHEKSEIARKAIEIILAEPSFNNFDWCEKAKKHPNWFYGHTHYCN